MDLHSWSQIVEKLWNGWELRILMLLSLLLQTILAFFGDRRKYATGFWLRSVVWLAYMSADWVATFSLGILARSQTNPANPSLIPVFWAPVLLLHLGGPETITAYSLADNELWIRRLLELVIQAGVVSYVLFKLWSKNTIIFVAVPILVSGIIKYGERIWAFRSFQMLSSNLILGYMDSRMTYEIVTGKEAKEAFALTEIELGFMYNWLHSKMTEISPLRIILHSITCLSSISALISFSKMTTSKNVYSKIDTMISYLLLVGAVLLDCYSITVFFLSDWGIIWLCDMEFPILYRMLRLSSLLPFLRKRKRWSNSMGQHNMITAQSNKPVSKILKKYFPGKWNVDKRRKVNKELKELIFKQVLDKRSRYDPSTADFNCLQKILAERGDQVLRSNGLFPQIGWSVADVEFTQSLLTWHIATHVCYLDDSRSNTFQKTQNGVRSSRSLSNYMLYLLVNCPAMIAIEPSEKRHADTRNHLLRLLRNARNCSSVKPSINKTEVNAFFEKLLENPSTMLKKIGIPENLEKSALLDGCMLALSLQSWETAVNGWSNGKKWEMISQVWVEMLMYAATHCRWKEHVHALSQGGELLTHVCVLMAHLGLSKQCPPVLNTEVEDREKRFHVFLDQNYICV
ncbi:hypothetical protein OIU79_013399 [Salix purpurea]|uniref:DUF4220 domain-containing protein n=1 Tax=Salix purpurea TaxID=77065 RepID=A0A9Q0T3U8_SALPP|nr:hypothetical protein OIU79_013399 [Salix purpurea]